MVRAAPSVLPTTRNGKPGRQQRMQAAQTAMLRDTPEPKPQPAAKKKLSYLEAREYASMEQTRCRGRAGASPRSGQHAEDPAIASDASAPAARPCGSRAGTAGGLTLYERWAELEKKQPELQSALRCKTERDDRVSGSPVRFSRSSSRRDSRSSGSGFISQAAISLSVAP